MTSIAYAPRDADVRNLAMRVPAELRAVESAKMTANLRHIPKKPLAIALGGA
jgi:hypothetical protein